MDSVSKITSFLEYYKRSSRCRIKVESEGNLNPFYKFWLRTWDQCSGVFWGERRACCKEWCRVWWIFSLLVLSLIIFQFKRVFCEFGWNFWWVNLKPLVFRSNSPVLTKWIFFAARSPSQLAIFNFGLILA